MNRIGGRAMILVRLGEAYFRKVRIADAERCGRRALMLARKHGERGHEAHALRLLAELGVTDSPLLHEESEANFLQALGRAEELDMRPLAAQCHLGLGKHYQLLGRQADAESHLNTAAALFRELDMQFGSDQQAPCGQLTSPS